MISLFFPHLACMPFEINDPDRNQSIMIEDQEFLGITLHEESPLISEKKK